MSGLWLCHITSRYFWVELATGLLFALTLTPTYDLLTIGLFWFMLVVLVVTVYDYYHYIIPDSLTLVLTCAVCLCLPMILSSRLTSQSPITNVLAALVVQAFFVFLGCYQKESG